MNARFYVSGVVRFASADTIVPDPANPQSYNRYTYVLNAPYNFTDPSGHSECGVGQYHCPEDSSTPTSSSETQILMSTVLIEITYQGYDDCQIGTSLSCVSYSHGTIADAQTLLTHNHFSSFDATVRNITLYDADGNEIPNNGQLIQTYITSSQISTLTFEPGTFDGLTAAITDNVSSSGVRVGDQVEVINWDGENPGSTYLTTANVIDMSTHEGVPVLQIDVAANKGASGGGVFFNGAHIANNWFITGESKIFGFSIPTNPRTYSAQNP